MPIQKRGRKGEGGPLENSWFLQILHKTFRFPVTIKSLHIIAQFLNWWTELHTYISRRSNSLPLNAWPLSDFQPFLVHTGLGAHYVPVGMWLSNVTGLLPKGYPTKLFSCERNTGHCNVKSFSFLASFKIRSIKCNSVLLCFSGRIMFLIGYYGFYCLWQKDTMRRFGFRVYAKSWLSDNKRKKNNNWHKQTSFVSGETFVISILTDQLTLCRGKGVTFKLCT